MENLLANFREKIIGNLALKLPIEKTYIFGKRT